MPAHSSSCPRCKSWPDRENQGVQLLRHHRKRVCPGNRLVVGRVFLPHHRSRQPPLLIQPVIRLRCQFFDRIPREKLRPDPLPRRLVRYRLRAVLAELEDLPAIVRTRPRTALAIESSDMVNFQKRLWSPHHAHIANAIEHRIPDSRNPGRLLRRRPHSQIAERRWILCLQAKSVNSDQALVRTIRAQGIRVASPSRDNARLCTPRLRESRLCGQISPRRRSFPMNHYDRLMSLHNIQPQFRHHCHLAVSDERQLVINRIIA